jgi:hypothetical protein
MFAEVLYICYIIYLLINLQYESAAVQKGFSVAASYMKSLNFQGNDEIRCTIQNVTAGFYCVLVSQL